MRSVSWCWSIKSTYRTAEFGRVVAMSHGFHRCQFCLVWNRLYHLSPFEMRVLSHVLSRTMGQIAWLLRIVGAGNECAFLWRTLWLSAVFRIEIWTLFSALYGGSFPLLSSWILTILYFLICQLELRSFFALASSCSMSFALWSSLCFAFLRFSGLLFFTFRPCYWESDSIGLFLFLSLPRDALNPRYPPVSVPAVV